MTTATRPLYPLPPTRPMTDLRAIEIAIHVMQATTGFAGLIAELTGIDEQAREERVDEITSALFRLQKIHADLSQEGLHCIEG